MRALDVFLGGRPVGTLGEADGVWRFVYDAAWQAAGDGFDLSPALPRAQAEHLDGGSRRPVQWYFDNLLPEEQLREAVSREAGLRGDDAFALLEYLGAESAGSLVLLPPGRAPGEPGGLRRLDDEALCARIEALPRATLASGAPKRMSAAGAQNKLLVVVEDGRLYEPVGAQPSTHILKPNHTGDDYPASVINEYVVMTLARRVGLDVPTVQRRYTPQPVYVVERFDRRRGADGRTERQHIVDACQLLDLARQFKYQAATLETLAALVERCRNRAATRLGLFRWLVFNVLVGNHDNHLKNLSFTVDAEGVELAPAYDLLCTAVYDTRAFAQERAVWPAVAMGIPLPGARAFGEATPQALLAAGAALGIGRSTAERELARLVKAVPAGARAILQAVETENEAAPATVRRFLGAELRVLRCIERIVIADMAARLGRA